MKNKKPEIRFKRFSEEWEEKELGKIGELKNGMNFGKEAMGHGYPFVNLQDVFGKSVVDNTNLGLAVSSENQRKDYNLLKGDVLFIRSSVKPEGVGETALVTENFENTTYSGFIIRFRANIEIDDNFKRIIFSTSFVRGQILSNSTSSANTNINQDSLKKIKLIQPSLFNEQTQIGNFFKNLDNLISLHQRKYEKLGILKKAMLEKMFPKNGADVPEIRFKGFSGAWEEKTLGDLFGIASASRVHKHEWTESGVPFFRSSDVVSDYKGQENTKAFISFELYEELSKKSGCVQKNDILVTGGGSIGIPYLVKSNEPLYFKDADLLWLKNSDNLNGYFLYIFFSTVIFRDYINSITHTGTISHYTIEQAKATPIKVPKREEQEKIGNYFKNLDNLLTLNHGELEKLKNLKKALLEKMFV
ncbi:restriction endonuclease subunit S [Runella sp.]|uniref:restriction endonuclease subunit S n=1 Tax=Runella sp. TaxID=1960881 RepID=UPI003018D50E